MTDANTDQPNLVSPRLLLRPFELADASRVQMLAGDERIAATTENIPHPYPDGAAESWIESHATSWASRSLVCFAITQREDSQLVGAISLIDIQPTQAEVGYWIGVDYWNKGYGTEATRTITQFGFEELKLKQLVAKHLTRNPASGKVLEKSGFEHVESTTVLWRNEREESLERYRVLSQTR